MWRWFSANFGDEIHLGGIRIGTAEGDLHRGWIWRDGEAASVREWRVRTELEEDGVTHRALAVDVTDKRDRTHSLRGEVLRVARIEHPAGDGGTILNEGLTRWTLDGATGYGISEYLHQLDASGRPAAPVE
jgi:hypothetical protein